LHSRFKTLSLALSLVTATGLLAGGCKENNVSADTNVGNCMVPAGTCPANFSPVVSSEGSIEACQMDGEGECKKVGSCTVRCEDPRGCTAEGSVCGDDKPACCGEAAGTTNCIHWVNDDPAKDKMTCSKRCTSNADCPSSCCDGTINHGSFAVCAPYDKCVSAGGLPPACRDCLEMMCPDELAACMQDETCAGCASADIYPQSPDCRNNPALKKGYGCALQKCPEVCEM
jgi:hypothetical protein